MFDSAMTVTLENLVFDEADIETKENSMREFCVYGLCMVLHSTANIATDASVSH